MNAPETIYLPVEEFDPFLSAGEYQRGKVCDTDVPYDRRKPPCVWSSFEPPELPGVTMWVPGCERIGMAEPTYPFCPYCGGRIEIRKE